MPFRAALAVVFVVAFAGRGSPQPAGEELFEKHVRPVLVERCLSCHAADKAKGGLRLDTRENLLKGGDGGPVVVAGKPRESRLIEAIRHVGDLKMPPNAKLPDKDVAALERWVSLGAPWPATVKLAAPDAIAKAAAAHWAFRPVKRPALPAPGHSIDAFVVARLEAARLSLSPPADKRTLIRRATFDLTGLPPTPEEIDDFLKDESPGAYEKVIDRLLGSEARRVGKAG